MATRKTYNFLPAIFQTDTNKKFLAATMDQLTTDPNLETLYGYIGRKFAPTFTVGDSYVIEKNKTRQNYQLEPSVVVQNDQRQTTFFADYQDLLDQIAYYGGNIKDHSRLFEQEYYSFDPKISFDKLINFGQYYWLPNGPDPVEVTTSGLDLRITYTVTRDTTNGRYIFKNNGVTDNSIILARGGVYEFVVDQPGAPFWIQTEIGTDGSINATPTISSRSILGVTNNGTDQGTITFRVPQNNAQDRFINMATVFNVDYATPIPYSELANKTLSQFLAKYPQYAGITGQLNGKYTVFLVTDAWNNLGETAWTNPVVYDKDGDIIPGYNAGEVIPESQRFGVWKIVYVDLGQKVKLDQTLTGNLTAGTRLTVDTIDNGAVVRSIDTGLLYDAEVGQDYVWVPTITWDGREFTVRQADAVTSLSTTTSGTNILTVSSTVGFEVDMPVVFAGTAIGDIVAGTTYYVKEILGPNTMTISATAGGSEFALTSATGVMSVTGSYTVIPIGSKVLNVSFGDPLLRLVHQQAVAADEKVYVKYGIENANKEYYKDYDGFFKQTPLITATLDQLWIQDGIRGDIYTPVKIVEYVGWSIDVETDIIGQQNYTSPNGVEFTSGLKVQFGDDVTPVEYQNRQFYVEQVGDIGGGIQLVPVDELVTPERYLDEIATNYPGEYLPDYITINRASKDRNGWSRTNRWFHADVITATATYNSTQANFDNGARAQRPIVQFEADYQLFNYGRKGLKPIDILDTTIHYAFEEFQGKTFTTICGVEIIDSDGNPVYPDGLRIIFAHDKDPLVANKVYDLLLVQYDVDTFGQPTGPYYIELSLAADGDVKANENIVIKSGLYRGGVFWFDGVIWHLGQEKSYLQQPPLFDVFDKTDKSFSNYSRSTFKGTQIFGYLRATSGVADPVLSRGPVAPIYDSTGAAVYNFYLSYKNFATQGDINFQNFFNSDTFSYLNDVGDSIITQKIDLGYLQKFLDTSTLVPKNMWLTVAEPSHQYQLISFVYDGTSNVFTIDVTPNTGERTIPYLKIFQNFNYLSPTEWSISNKTITINSQLTVNDQIDILVYSSEISKMGFFQIPQNLDLNAQNIDITTLTLGQLRNHLVALSQNSTIVEGNILAQSNLRDIDIKQQGGTILQHSAPVPYASLFLIDKQANFINSIRFAQQEYTKFKNKFLELSLSLPGINANDPISSVDLILNKINQVKNKTFPWYYSDMVPYGPLKNTVGQIGNIDGFEVFDPLKTNYEITEIFNDRQLSNKAVLIYLNDQQLIKDQDYTFNRETPSVDFKISLEVGDILKIVEYSNTDANFIPETPSKLGLWPAFVPQRFYDNTYRTPTYVIRGHDGSITPTFNDYRDEFLLELEKRIYNNIKLAETNTFSDIFSLVPGRFREGDYSLLEFNQIVSTSFLNWVGNNKLDYSTNETFLANDPFTWNYSSSQDKVDGSLLPGSWRACYQYFYDTYRPHLTPWECLGFSAKPDWWEGFYGPEPYTGGNSLLWQDLESGYIRYGYRQGVDLTYARPGLSKYIPVDENGNLIPPAQILCKVFNSKKTASAWSVGQQGPVEFAWRTSSDFPFAVQQALALARPAEYFGSLIDNYTYTSLNPIKTADSQQYLLTSTNGHLTQSAINFNGNTDAGSIYRGAGYLNWVADYLINQGINPSNYLINLLKNFQVNLTYKVSGFTDQNYLEILAEQVSPTSTNNSILIPNENYKIYLNDNPVVVDKITYSAVIIEKTTNGYSVRGYDLFNSFFTIIPSVVNNNSSKITVLNSSAAVYNDYQNLKINVPYGYEFNTQQQVSDFLVSYERWLIAQGFTFDDIDPQLNQVKDWKLSVREFLYWSQQGWKPGSILVVSPVSNTLNAISIGAVTQGISDSQYGSRVLDQNFNLIKNNKYTVYRTPSDFKLTIDDAASVIGYVEINLVQYEHTLIFDNVTVFNDVIYQPESGNRQYRLKVIGQRTADWDGSLSPAGFVYNSGQVDEWNQGQDYLKGDLVQYKKQYYTALKDTPANPNFQWQNWQILSADQIQKGLLPNFSTIAVESQSYYDSYAKIRNKDQVAYSHALIGFKKRQYMADLGLTETTQIEFYKGYIAQKGSKNAVDAFTSANINNLTSSISMYEEWAVRVGEYGALVSNPFVEIPLDEKTFGINPSVARFVDDADINLANGIDIFNSRQLYKSYGEYSANVALNRTSISNYDNDIPVAGYVNIDDVDTQIFDLANYSDLDGKIADMGSGYLIWVAKDFSQQWNVYRVTETNNHIVQVTNSLNGFITFTTKTPHELEINNVFLVKDFITEFDGFYQVFQIVDSNRLLVKYSGDVTDLISKDGDGILLRLDSMRFRYMEDSRVYGLTNPPNGWKVGDKIWIDDDAETTEVQGQPFGTQPSGTWKVYEKQHPWSLDQEIIKNSTQYSNIDQFGTSVKMSSDGLIIVAGSPGYSSNVGRVTTWLKDFQGLYKEGYALPAVNANVRSFGHTVDLATDGAETVRMAVGAPNSFSGNGLVYVYHKAINSQIFVPAQILQGNVAGDQFGYSLTFNRDGEWLYVGAPGNNTVYAYGLKRFIPFQQQTVSIKNKTTLYLSGNISVNPTDVIIQANTGARTSVISVVSNREIVVDSLTNFVTATVGSDGNVTSGNTTILANISILSSGNLAVTSVFPIGNVSNAAVSSVTLNFTPTDNDANSLVISDPTKTFIPGLEYTLSGSTVNFAANLQQTTLTITQQPYYSLLTKLPIPTGNSWAQYGYALSSSFDGAQLAVGAPGDTVQDLDGVLQPGAGAVYVFDRVIEAFNTVTDAAPGTGGQDYQTENPISNVYKVTIDGIEVDDYQIVGTNTVRFVNPPAIGQVIYVEVNQFNLLERIIGVDSLEGGLAAIQANAAFGTSLTICSNNCAIYIGAPYYDNGTQYNSGAVWKFHNRGRLYGTDTGYVKNPTFKPIDTIRLNNFEVRVSLSLSGVVNVNAGDWITQPSTGANVQVLESATVTYRIKTSKYQNSNVFVTGANIAINGSWLSPNVYVQSTNLDNFVQDINESGILGVTASNQNGYLQIDSDVKVAKDQLRILSGNTSIGSSGILSEAGTIVFAFMQIIINPFGLPGEYFGNKVKLASNAYMLVIGSARGTTRELTNFDIDSTVNGTVFDDDTTIFTDDIVGSGSVYIYELYDDPRNEVEHPGRYAFAQQLIPDNLVSGDQFGYAIDIENRYVTVSALTTDTASGNGAIYVFSNPSNTRGWKLIRYQEPRVDIDSISRGFLYDGQTNLIKENLQFIDPAKGRILGPAEQEISFKTEYDPAVYNRGNNPAANINQNLYWGDFQLGKVWWNLSKVRYIDYEQDTLIYRSLHWGELFAGSSIEICEWISSIYLPSQYVDNVNDGSPLYPDDSAYVEQTQVDAATGIITTVYYYWVTNKTTVDPNNETRKLPTNSIADFIANPKNQGIPYAALIRSNAMAFYNIAEYLSADNTIMHLDHQLVINTDLIHSEYELIQKGNPNVVIPSNIVNKLVDSLSGIDRHGSPVPDPNLSPANRYGISIRPRQSMFIDRLAALNELIQYVNSVFAANPIVEQFNISGLNAAEPEPNFKAGEYDLRVETEAELYYIDTTDLDPGYLVLVGFDTTQSGLWVLYQLTNEKTWQVSRVQSYKASLYWYYIDWYAQGYSASTRPDFSVGTTADAIKLNATPGTIIYIQNATGNNTWQLVEVDVGGTLKVIGIQEGTIQINSNLANYADTGLGFGNQDFDSNRYDQNPNIEIRNMIGTVYSTIFTNTLQGEFGNLFFIMINYLLNEQNYVDWLFKSSFIGITHKLRTLSQFPSYTVDNQTYYQNYIEEVKPYRTKIREYLLNYTGNDMFGGDITDFDLPAYYDTSLNYPIFRSPSGENPYTRQDQNTWQNWPYNQWYDHRSLQVYRIEIGHAGANYGIPPTVTITSSNGFGSGATAVAIVDGNTGAISNIRVTNSGIGYTSTPIVTINGSSDSPASGYAVMYNPQVRNFSSKLKFDRIKYNSNVKVWSANTTYIKTEFDANGRVISGDIITRTYQDGNATIRASYFVNANVTTGNAFLIENYTLCPSSYFDNANDRIVGYYEPTTAMPAIDLINTPITLVNSAVNTDTIYVFNSQSMVKNMYINGNGVEAGYITEIVGNVTVMVNGRGHFLGNLSTGISSIENINNMSGLNIGEYVSGQGVPFEARILSINYTTNSINLSDTITANVSFANISFGGIPIKASKVSLSANVTLSTDSTVYGRFDSLEQLIPGVSYPYAVTRSTNFKVTPLFGRSYDLAPFDPVQYSTDGIALLSTSIYDQALYSLYANLALGTAPEDIITDGGQFIDTYHSRAPEELVPGIMFDTLDLRVFTTVSVGEVANISLGYRIFENMMDEPSYLRIGLANSSPLSRTLLESDSYIHVANAAVFTPPDPIRARPGVVFINGERITFYRNYRQELTPWVSGVGYAADRILSYAGNNYISTNTLSGTVFDTLLQYQINLLGNLTAVVGSYVTQIGSNVNAVIVSANVTNSNVVVVQYLTQPTQFDLGGGNLRINGELVRPANVVVTATSYGGNIIQVNNTNGLYVGMYANVGFNANAQVIAIYANANVVMNSANVITLDGTAISFGDTGTGDTTSTGIGVRPVKEFGNLRMLDDVDVLTQLRRGTQGTSTYPVIPVFTQVVDAGAEQIIPGTSYGNLIQYANVFYNSGAMPPPLDGQGMQNSTTTAALFLRVSPSAIDQLPGTNQALTDEDAINTLTTEDDNEIYTEGL